MSGTIKNQISECDIKAIARMHICASKSVFIQEKISSEYRFFLDKVRHFYTFDPRSIIVKRDEENKISGVLIYTHSEKAFNEFSGPKHIRFYVKVLKTLLGFYGFKFKKFFLAAKSMLGTGGNHSSKSDDDFGKIWVLIVAEEDRKKGIATELLQECIKRATERKIKTLRVTVKKDNIPAIKTYEKIGFKIIGECIESSGESFIMETDI